jgi:hypothetical protein
LTAYYGIEISSQKVVCFACDLILDEQPPLVVSPKEDAALMKNAAEKLKEELEEYEF